MHKVYMRLAYPIFIWFILIKSFAGPIGLVLPAINYSGVVFMAGLLILRWIGTLLHKPTVLVLTMLFILYVIIGIINTKLLQVVFAIYIFIPFIYCIAFSDILFEKVFYNNKFFLILSIISAFGVIYVNQFGAPWVGGVLNIGGHEKVLSRDWTTNGVSRIPGFTGASFDAATIIMISGFFVLYDFVQRKLWGAFLFLVILLSYAIYLTTTKTAIITFGFLSLMILLPAIFSNLLSKIIVLISVIFSYICMFSITGNRGSYITNTFVMRMYETWPAALRLLDDNLDLIFGRGFGAIGTPALFFDPKHYNAADNAFVYLYIIAGIPSVILVFACLVKYFTAVFNDTIIKNEYYLCSLCVFIGGLTYNLFESVFYAPFAGILVGIIFQKNHFPADTTN